MFLTHKETAWRLRTKPLAWLCSPVKTVLCINLQHKQNTLEGKNNNITRVKACQ